VSPTSRHLRRLPGRWYGVATKAQAWREDDHLLYIERAWFIERACRLAFRDIEAVVLQATPRRARGTIAGLVVASLGAAMVLPPVGLLRWSGAVVAVVALTVAAIHWLRGPTCEVTVRTRVTETAIRCWRRRRTAARALAMLDADIVAAQGAMSPAEVIERAAERARAEVAALEALSRPTTPPPLPSSPPPPLPASPPPRAAAMALIGTLLLDSAVAAGLVGVRRAALWAGLAVTAVAMCVLAAVVLVRSGGSTRGRPLGRWAAELLVYWTVRGLVLYVLLMVPFLVSQAALAEAPYVPGRQLPEIRFGLAASVVFAITSAGSALMAARGVFLLRRAGA